MLIPSFEKGKILKQSMLEAIKIFPRISLNLLFEEYGYGIIQGFNIRISERKVFIGPGICKYNGEVLISDKTLEVELANQSNFVYLEPDYVKNPDNDVEFNLRLICSNLSQPNKFELFRCEKEASSSVSLLFSNPEELRYSYVPMNRLNRIYAPYSYRGGTSLSRDYLRIFGRQFLIRSSDYHLDPYDIAFATQFLNGVNDIEVIRTFFGDESNDNVIKVIARKMNFPNETRKEINNSSSYNDRDDKIDIN